MARQSSFIKLEGTIGDVTFYKSKTGYKARQKGGVSRDRIMNDAQFERTRENIAEFTQAARAGKILKDAFREITLRARDIRTHNRIYSQALKVLKTDSFSNRGERKVENGDISLFEGFQFSNNSMMEATVYCPYSIDNGDTSVDIQFGSFVPRKYLAFPSGSTHFKFFVVGVGVDFEQGESRTEMQITDAFPLDNDELPAFNVEVSKVVDMGNHQFYALGIEFLQEVNDKLYTLNNGAHNAAKMILTQTT
ncbi:hypothetical protein KI659_16935 [Litoribacter alkaliphilus]|uniref:Uncharacterized protein n=1 Tax=Litoribacter ruber TaxID=702568 RepID=A0AAP2CK94_9BACT|nr:hypothetical protein [Litoribacter alkaliphilus]MBS9525707.1 hypothetical protein [Litoribacter alkaliphilus]